MTEILIVVPVLGRPARVAPLVEAARDGTQDVPYHLLFVCSPDDTLEIAAVERTGASLLVAPFPAGAGDFAKKANLALAASGEPWIFVVGDDVCFCPGWATAALEQASAAGAGVVGTNDLANPRVMAGETATHNLVARWYAEDFGTVDERGAIFHEGYDHNYVDDELVSTAKARDAWAFAAHSLVPHFHPNQDPSLWDLTYEKGQARFADDRLLFQRRSVLWQDGLAPATAPDDPV